VRLRVAGSSEPLAITCPSIVDAENMADLIDGYCRVVNNAVTSIWSRRGIRPHLFCAPTYYIQLCLMPRYRTILSNAYFYSNAADLEDCGNSHF
jgi:hypothetical protein